MLVVARGNVHHESVVHQGAMTTSMQYSCQMEVGDFLWTGGFNVLVLNQECTMTVERKRVCDLHMCMQCRYNVQNVKEYKTLVNSACQSCSEIVCGYRYYKC